VPDDWTKVVIVPIYNPFDRSRSAEIFEVSSAISVVGKLYAKVLIERVVKETERVVKKV
jgi:hypothetical protein